jgi:hypothetical protein
LHESEQVDSDSGFPQAVEHWLRIVQKLVFVRVEARDPEQSSLDPDLLTTNPDQ